MKSAGWTILVKNYLPVDEALPQRMVRVMAEIERLPDSALDVDQHSRTITIDCSQVVGWRESLRDRLGVVRAGRHFVVCPPWCACQPGNGEVVLSIDPGIAFGSGLHESTRLCLSVLEDIVYPGCTAVDFGSGSGVLAIAAAKLGAGRVIAIEADEESADIARGNAKRNSVDHVVSVICSDSPHGAEVVADIITANITPRVIGENLSGLVSVLRCGGTIVMSGMTVRNCYEVEDILPQSGLLAESRRVEGEWIALVAAKTGSGAERQ